MKEKKCRILVSGHKNPDVDSIAAAVALAELRRRQGAANIRAICPGVMPERAKYLFEKFKYPLPESVNDLYIHVSDVMDNSDKVIRGGTSLYQAVGQLNDSGLPRLPVVGDDDKFIGMLSPLALLSSLLNVGSSGGLAGRKVNTSLRLIAEVISAKLPDSCPNPDEKRTFSVYVGAMGADSFDEHLPRKGDLVVIVGDRPEIHMRALQRKIRLLIVTGGKPVEPLIEEEARRQQVAILKTDFDSAMVIRRLKFSVPVENFISGDGEFCVSPQSRLRSVSSQVINQPEDVVPVVSDDRKIAGILLKKHISETPPAALILVDHNEIAQSLPGAEELPLIEVVDHHRIGMRPTVLPIRFTGDVVGSTCTIVASMFKSAGESLSPALAGILLGGIVSDTLNLMSPTTAPLDRKMVEFLEKISGVSSLSLMQELNSIASPLAAKSAVEVIESDRKNYADGKFKFSISQVEETDFELLNHRLQELSAALDGIVKSGTLSFAGIMVTDAVRGNSRLLIVGDEYVIEALPYDRLGNGTFDLPGVVSRKKQLLPQILSITAALNRI